MRTLKNITEFFKEKGFAILLLSIIFTLGSMFWTNDIAYNHKDLSVIELGWPISFVIQNHSQLDPPEWWFPHKIGFGLPQEYSTSLNFLPFGFSIVLNFLIIFSIIFVILKFNPRLLFLRKIISVKYIVGAIGAALFIFISFFIYINFTRPQIGMEIPLGMEIPPPDISFLPPPLENKMGTKINRVEQSNQLSDIQKIVAKIPSWPIDENQTQEWGKYTSQKLGISFKYPKNYLVVEAKETTTPAIGESFSLVILEDNQHNRHYAKTINADFDYNIPENQENTDIEPPSGIITLSKTIAEYDFTKKGLAQGIGDRSISEPANFLGMGSAAYQAEGLFTFEGMIFEKERYTYQFDVAYDSPTELARSDFYKIISTIEFKTTLLDQKIAACYPPNEGCGACRPISNNSVQYMKDTARHFINLPKDVYPYENIGSYFKTVSGNATVGWVSNGGLPGYALESTPKCWSTYYDFGGTGEIHLKVKSAIKDMPDYFVRFIIGF